MIANVEYDFAPVLDSTPQKVVSKWDAENRAFERLLPQLLSDGLTGKYVAIHDGNIVGIGEDKFALADEAYRRFGYQSILVKEIAEQVRVVRLPSIRVVRPGGK